MQRIIEISSRKAVLRIRNGSLCITVPEAEMQKIPVRDIAVLVLSEHALSLSGTLFAEASEHGFSIVLCSRNYTPAGIFYPVDATSRESAWIRMQSKAKKQTMNRIWKKIVQRKILNQAVVVRYFTGGKELLLHNLARKITVGDKNAAEAEAAAFFWKTLHVFPKRDRLANDANILFNYAYTILFAVAARAVCAAGLHPAFGVSHHNQYNPFCLASDLMEVFRIAGEFAVLRILPQFHGILTKELKAAILAGLSTSSFRWDGKKSGLFETAVHMAVSLRENLTGRQKQLGLPEFLPELL